MSRSTEHLKRLLFPLVLALSGCAATPLAREVVVSKDAPAPIGPYSQAVRAGNLLFLSGQAGLDPKTGQLSGGSIEEQTTTALENLKAVLAANNMTMADIVSTTVYLKDIGDFGKMNAVYARFFPDKPPARATIQAARLPRDSLVQISAIAAR
ncbi:RidA family protein [Roseateles saccharophilus]|uniref:Endoribonuclease L-PSP n=1 Tax=Roseateles saccharophilus TaxID=304 RepID=A0A4R3VEE2_ROSSA|nr:RidA family protein [Roseateles saccharophilus]MDG0834552.1 RidA family protein [Roseateles saccharophilus]TCV03756.1 endoribonuclease L-PSP [Roseateles saccharophilus]